MCIQRKRNLYTTNVYLGKKNDFKLQEPLSLIQAFSLNKAMSKLVVKMQIARKIVLMLSVIREHRVTPEKEIVSASQPQHVKNVKK